MNDKVKKLEEEWANEERTEEEAMEDALLGMEVLLYTSRAIKVEGNSNVTVTEVEDKKCKK